jgi:RNA-directed DNA polymerase
VLSDTASTGGRKVADQTAQDTRELASSGDAPVGVRSGDGESSVRAQPPSARKKKHYSLYDKVCTKRNLWQAWLRVKANKGAPGCDGVTVQYFDANAREFLKALRKQLRGKTYRPRPVRRKSIPKRGGGMRNLGIPCVRDRIVQQALKQVLEPIFEPKFSEHSHGFRPKKGPATACRTAEWAVSHGYEWVVDLDLKDFFVKLAEFEPSITIC